MYGRQRKHTHARARSPTHVRGRLVRYVHLPERMDAHAALRADDKRASNKQYKRRRLDLPSHAEARRRAARHAAAEASEWEQLKRQSRDAGGGAT